ncbi:MAG: GMC family oxidoreductase, partial [Dinoroseobacter sp.]|nr:GMC family oxidoreductase [Dinoroseobacter sp.]
IENVGILLNTDLAKGNDHVGRYFMEHPHLSPGEVVFEKGFQTDKLKAFVASAYKGFQGERPAAATEQGRLVFRTSREFCEKHKIGNCLLWGNATTAGVASGGVRSLHELQRLKDLEIEPPEGVRQKHLSNILSSPGSIAGSKVKKQLARLRRKLGQPQDENAFFLHMETEQVPNPDSRVVLSNELDEFGLPRTTLDWKLSDFDHASIATTLREFGNTLKANGIGHLRNSLSENDPVPQIGGGCHHMGGTRMSADAKSGVVDANLRLHGTENFYIAGSSCFPTSGASNPTLTLIALSVRLAEELNAKATKEHQPNTVRASESA